MRYDRYVYIGRKVSECFMRSTVSTSAKMMVSPVILILTYVQLLMVEGLASKPVNEQNGNPTNSSRRIIYGERADVSKFRFLVKLERTALPCAGAIVSMHLILTAADCLRDITCHEIQIYPLAWPYPQNVYAHLCYWHKKHLRFHTDYNIGIVRVQPSILEDGRATYARLPIPGKRYPKGTEAVFPGWGLNENHVFVPYLQEVTVRLDDWEVCNEAYRLSMVHENCKDTPKCMLPDIAARVICAQGQGWARPSFCLGDIGGPLVIDQWIIGVASIILRKNKECAFNAPMIFTEVVDYLPWIYPKIDSSFDTSNFSVKPEHEYTLSEAHNPYKTDN